jgi:hypothetical protein
MKKDEKLAILCIVLVLICATIWGCTHSTKTFEIPAVVEEVNPATEYATLVDWQGEAWVCEADGLQVGQLVIIVFDDMGTEDIYDDEIIKLRVG